MTEFFKYPAQNFDGEDIKSTIATGPVIINDKGEFLLHKSSSTNKLQFTGGRLDDSLDPRTNAIQKPLEDLGIRVSLASDVEPFIVIDSIERDGVKEMLVLIHYLAELQNNEPPTKSEWKWLSLNDIIDLDHKQELSSPNILLACKHFIKQYEK